MNPIKKAIGKAKGEKKELKVRNTTRDAKFTTSHYTGGKGTKNGVRHMGGEMGVDYGSYHEK